MRDPRLNVSSGLSQARLKLQARRAAAPLAVVLLGFGVGIAIFAYIAVQTSKTVFAKTEQVRFEISDATGIVAGQDDVRISGLPVGRLIKLDRTPDGRIVVTAKIAKKYLPIYRDARAELRPVTPLQDMYLDVVDRGTPAAGKLEGDRPLPAPRTSVPVNIDDVLNVFRPTERSHLASLLNNLGNGLKDHGIQLRTAFTVAAPLLQRAGKLSDALATRSVLVKRLVHNTSTLTGELGSRDVRLRTLVRDANTTMGALADRAPALDRTLQQLPSTLSGVRRTFGDVSAILPDVNIAVDRLQPVARSLPQSLAALRSLSVSAAPALAALRPPVTHLTPLARALSPLSKSLAVTVDALRPQVATYDRATVDAAKCKKGLAGFFLWNTSIGKFSDARGPTLRGNLVAGADASSVAYSPFDFAPTACVGGTIVGGGPPQPKDMH
jgi:virulence factor Mce-like protein